MKTMRIFLVGLMFLTVMASPLLAVAQDDDEMEVDTSDWEEFTSEDEIFTLLLPPDWIAGAGEESGSIILTNDEALLETFNDEDAPAEPGQKVIAIFGLLPSDILALIGVELTEESTTEDLITGISGFFMGEPDEDEEDDMVFGEMDVLELSDDAEVGVLEISSEANSIEGYFFAYQTPDSIVAMGIIATYAGEFDAEFEATVIAILDNVEINITSDELMEMLNQ